MFPENLCWNPSPQGDAIRRWLGHEVGSWMWLVLLGNRPQIAPMPPVMWDNSKIIYETGSPSHWTPSLPAHWSRISHLPELLFVSHPVFGIWFSSPNGLRKKNKTVDHVRKWNGSRFEIHTVHWALW